MLEFCRILLPLVAVLCFLWAAWNCAVRVLFPSKAGVEPVAAGQTPLWKPALLCLGAGLAVQLLFVIWACRSGTYDSVLEALEAQFYGNTDARHYLDLAAYGYGTGEAFPEQYLMIVFFPLFPGLLRLLNVFGWFDYHILALVVQLPLFCAAGTGLFVLVRRQYDEKTAWRTLVLLVISPASVFFWAPMTESLFLALSVWYIMALQKGYWGRAAGLGALAGLTRAPGGLLSGLAFLYLFQNWRRNGKRPPVASLPAMLAPALGLGLYFGLNAAIYGRWDQYSVFQWEHWGQKLGLFTDTIRYHLSYLQLWWDDNRSAAVWICLAAVICIMLTFGLLAAAARQLPASWLGYGLAYLVVVMGATWLISGPRYAVALFCLPVALAALLRGHPQVTWGVASALFACNVAYTIAYLSHQPIY